MAMPQSRHAFNQRNSATEQSTASQIQDQASHLAQAASDVVTENPGTTALVTFGIGIGFGLMLTAMLAPPRRRTWYDEVSDRVPDISVSDLREAVASVLPNSLRRYM